MNQLLSYLRSRVPGAALIETQLVQVPQISLWLLAADYPQEQLGAEAAQALMDSPPYWSFCWASGQVLAAEILAKPDMVKGKVVIDYGAGSGVVAIAAAKAGAILAIACDTDPYAREVCIVNAHLNGVSIEVAESLEQSILISKKLEGVLLVTIADVFYDRDNLPILNALQNQVDQILVADSRLNGQSLPRLALVKTVASCTVPDLNESKDFNRVNIYASEELEEGLMSV